MIRFAKTWMITMLLSLVVVLAASALADAQQTIVAAGMGVSRTAALEDARRKAVEQGVGTFIDSHTQVANFVVLHDKIYARATGYVTRETIVSEGTAADGLFVVTIRAAVQAEAIKNDLRALGILLSQIGNPRTLTIYQPVNPANSMPRNSRLVNAAENSINGVFVPNGFLVLDQPIVNTIYKEIEKAGRIDVGTDDLAEMALRYHAELLLLYDIQVMHQDSGKSMHFGGYKVSMQLRAVRADTAEQIAMRSASEYVRTSSSDPYSDDQAATAAANVGRALAGRLVDDAIAHFDHIVHFGTRFDIWIRNFSEKELFIIMDVIEAMHGWKDSNVRNQTPGNFQVDIHYQGKKFDLQRELARGLAPHSLEFSTQQAKGNRLLLFKAGTDSPFQGVVFD